MIISLDAEHEFDKFEPPFTIKTLSTVEIARSFLNPIKFFDIRWSCRSGIWSGPFKINIKINVFSAFYYKSELLH